MESTERPWWHDGQFLVALLAACPYWGALYAYSSPRLHLSWPVEMPTTFLSVALVFPVLEELVFRGFVQERLHNHLHGGIGRISHANLITSIIFALLHLIEHPPMWAAAVFIPSLVFGYFRDRSGGLGAPIALHVFYNSGYFWLFGSP